MLGHALALFEILTGRCSRLVMAGLVPAIHVLLRNGLEEVVPLRIGHNNQSNLPGAWPMFDIMFALDCILDRLESFEVDNLLQSVSFREAFDEPGPMLEHAADKIACHADIEDAVPSVGHEINVAACHAEILQDVDGRDKPGHDECGDTTADRKS